VHSIHCDYDDMLVVIGLVSNLKLKMELTCVLLLGKHCYSLVKAPNQTLDRWQATHEYYYN